MKDFYGEPGELKINISLDYQLFCNNILKYTTEKALLGDHIARYKGLKQLTLKLYPKISEQDKEKIREIDTNINRQKQTIENGCDYIESILINVMDQHGMLFPKWQSEGGDYDSGF